MLGKNYSVETLGLISKALTGDKKPMFGKTHTIETVTKMSVTKGGGTIFVYNTNGSLVNSFCSARKAGEYFNCFHITIIGYVKNKKIFQGKWRLTLSAKG